MTTQTEGDKNANNGTSGDNDRAVLAVNTFIPGVYFATVDDDNAINENNVRDCTLKTHKR